MSEESPVDSNDPMYLAWMEYKRSYAYGVSESWALHKEHTEGSMWAAFVQGWTAAKADSTNLPYKAGIMKWVVLYFVGVLLTVMFLMVVMKKYSPSDSVCGTDKIRIVDFSGAACVVGNRL